MHARISLAYYLKRKYFCVVRAEYAKKNASKICMQAVYPTYSNSENALLMARRERGPPARLPPVPASGLLSVSASAPSPERKLSWVAGGRPAPPPRCRSERRSGATAWTRNRGGANNRRGGLQHPRRAPYHVRPSVARAASSDAVRPRAGGRGRPGGEDARPRRRSLGARCRSREGGRRQEGGRRPDGSESEGGRGPSLAAFDALR